MTATATHTQTDSPAHRAVPMAQPRILIIEDERGLTQSLTWYFLF